MEYKVGDKVRIKSEDWYKQMLSIPNKLVWQNKLTNDFVGVWCGSHIFKESMFGFLGKTMTIQEVGIDFYLMEEDTCGYEFNDEMIEGLVKEETKPKFKVGDRVMARDMSGIWEITNVEDDILYTIKRENHTFTLTTYGSFLTLYEGISDKKEEVKSENSLLDEYEELTDRAFKGGYEKCKSDIELNGFQIPDGYVFKDENGNVINATKIVLEKKKKEYPKNYEECCKVLHYAYGQEITMGGVTEEEEELFRCLILLKRCRDAYWRIAGDEMGLGKPWEPDWMNNLQHKHYISTEWDEIKINFNSTTNKVLAFPTAEMRDAFYENFKEEIEFVKELL